MSRALVKKLLGQVLEHAGPMEKWRAGPLRGKCGCPIVDAAVRVGHRSHLGYWLSAADLLSMPIQPLVVDVANVIAMAADMTDRELKRVKGATPLHRAVRRLLVERLVRR